MNKAIKWILIIGGGLTALVILALLIIPMVIDVQDYKPQIEKRISDATGRTITLGGDLKLSLFPWAGLSFSDLHLGNPAGFSEKDLLVIDDFVVKVKFLPLLFKDIQVKRFVLNGVKIILEKKKNGQAGWEGIAPSKKSDAGAPEPVEKKSAETPAGPFPLKSLAIEEFQINNGSVLWIDNAAGSHYDLSDFDLDLKDVSLNKPIKITLSARVEDHPVSLEGSIGPVGSQPGKGTIPVDFSLKALKTLAITVGGTIVDPATRPGFDLSVKIDSFSPRKLTAALGRDFPLQTTDTKVLNRISLAAAIKGSPQDITISEGILELDDTKLKFSAQAKDFTKPDIAFDLVLDAIDLDRYMPPPTEKAPSTPQQTETAQASPRKIDYAPLRKLVLNGSFQAGQLKVANARIQDFKAKVTGQKGQFQLKPLAMALYQGSMDASGRLDVRRDTPTADIALTVKGIQAGPLLRDVLEKDIIEGAMQAEVALQFSGDVPDKIKKTLNGKGTLSFANGAIKGVDLAGMARNAKAAFGIADKDAQRPRTDFSELNVPFTLQKGVFRTDKTSIISPLLRVLAAGTANLVNENLDFRIEPKVVATLKGQGDATDRSGITVPILVTGTFNAPKFRPDLKGILQQQIGTTLPDLTKGLKDGLPTKEATGQLEEKAKSLLKKLPF
jgi:AsmA protein